MRIILPAGLLLLLSITAPVTQAATGPHGYSVLDSRSDGLPFLDVRWEATEIVAVGPEGRTEMIDLPFGFPWYARTYRQVVVSEDGWIGFVPSETGTVHREPRAGGLLPEADVAARDGTREPEAFLDVLGLDWTTRDGGWIQVQSEPDAFTVRWVRIRSASGRAQASFEAILHRGGQATLQYFEVRDPAAETGRAAMGTRPERGEGIDLAPRYTPRGGLRVTIGRPGRGVGGPVRYIQGDCADFDGDTNPDNTAPPWCDTVNPPLPSIANCTVHVGEALGCGGQAGGFPETDCSACTDTEAVSWHFNENNTDPQDPDCYCKGCRHTFYVLVECGTEMHMPFFDMEGARIRVFDAVTGNALGVRAENDCVKAPFRYCNACSALGVVVPEAAVPDYTGGNTCQDLVNQGLASFTNCTAYEQETTPAAPEAQWGRPTPPPCIADSNACPDGTGTNLAHELQNTDVILADENGLCGVFRVEIESGGCVWDFFANCDGSSSQGFRIFHNCGDALTAFNPLPEYILDNVTQTGICPQDPTDPNRPTVEVTLANVGCCDMTGDADSVACETAVGPIPVEVIFEDPDSPGTNVCPGTGPNGGHELTFDPALLKMRSGTTQMLPLPYPCDFDTLPARAIVTADPADVVHECTEEPTASKCEAADPGDVTLDVCTCEFFLTTDLQGPDAACISSGQASVDLDGSGSASNPPCTSSLEYRFYRVDPGDLTRIEEITPDPANPLSPALNGYTFDCADQEEYGFEMEVRCPDETLDPIGCVQSEYLTGFCGVGDPMVLESDPDIQPPQNGENYEVVCIDTQFELAALINSTPPVSPITWDAELRDIANPDTPGTPYPEALANCVENGNLLTCSGFPEGTACDLLVSYLAYTQDSNDCDTEGRIFIQVQNDMLRPVDCSLHLERGGADRMDLQFRFNPTIFQCPASPAMEVVAYPCVDADFSTCPNGNPPGTGEFNLDYMEADGLVVGGGDTVPIVIPGGIVSAENLTFYQVRSVAACEGPAPLGLTGSPPFNCR